MKGVASVAVFCIPLMYLMSAPSGANGLAEALVIAETASAVFAWSLMERWKKKNFKGARKK